MKNSNPYPSSISHKLLRATLAVVQIFSVLSAALIGVAQPTLPASLAALQPLVGLPERALAALPGITGSISFAGGFSPLPNSGTAIVSDLNFFNIDSSAFGLGPTGDLSGAGGAAVGSSFGLNTSSGPQLLYSTHGYSFYLTNIMTVTRNPLHVQGVGVADDITVIARGYVTHAGNALTLCSIIFTAQGTGLPNGTGGVQSDATSSWSSSISMIATAQFGDFVWTESDSDGIASTGTITPVLGQVITATSATGIVYTQTTNSQGYYTFTVPAGTYTVTYGAVPAGMLPSLAPNPSTASAASPGTDQRSRPNNTVVTLLANDVISSIDFAFHPAPIAGVCNNPYLDKLAETQVASTATGSPTATIVTGSGILGGERDMAISTYSSSAPGVLNTRARVLSGNLFSVANDPQVSSVVEVVYDGVDTSATSFSPTGLGGLNLSGTNNFLRTSLTSLDPTLHLTITVEIYTNGTNASRQTLSFIGPVGVAQTVAFPVSGFTSFLGAGATLSNVGAVRILFSSDAAADYTLEGAMFTPCDLPADTYDWGDLPNLYHTITGSLGANHVITPGLRLGATIDAESGGQPTTLANGDGSDEDGVLSGLIINTGSAPVIQVNAVNTTTQAATLYGFVDLNGDGVFGAGETMSIAVPANGSIGGGTYVLNFTATAPQVTVPTLTYARFRLSTQANLDNTGPALDGEVEDYPVTINPPFSGAITVTKQVSGTAPISQTYNVTVNGPSSYISNTTFSAGETKTFTNLVPGVYTVTEASPGSGWQVTYTASSSGWVTQTLSGSQVVLTVSNPITAPLTAAGTITGIVYNDYNSNGVRNTTGISPNLAIDNGVAGVVVMAYDRDGTPRGTATTDPNGVYTLTTTGNGPYRIEFTNLQTGYYPSVHGAQNDTSTQFASAGATSVNLGLNQPSQYSQNNPPLVTSIFQYGNSITGPNSSETGLVRFPYDAGSTNYPVAATPIGPYQTPPPLMLTTVSQVGTVYGIAYQRVSKSIFASAYTRRHADFGPGGPGAIYRYDAGSGTTSVFVDLNSASYFNGSLGADLHPATNVPDAACPNSPTTPNGQGCWWNDRLTFDQVGKTSFGDLDLSEDEQTLYVVDLANRKVLGLPIGSVPSAPALAVIKQYPSDANLTGVPNLIGVDGDSDDCPAASEVRPFGLGVRKGRVYVGMICTAESTRAGGESNLQFGRKIKMVAYVYSFDPAGTGLASSFQRELRFKIADLNNGAGQFWPWLTLAQFEILIPRCAGSWRIHD